MCFVVHYFKSAKLATEDLREPTEPFDDGNLVPNGQQIWVTGMKVYTRRWTEFRVVGGILQSSFTLGLELYS